MRHRATKIEVLKARNGQWFYRIVSSNGKTMDSGETYLRKGSAFSAACKLVEAMRREVKVGIIEPGGKGKVPVLSRVTVYAAADDAYLSYDGH